jgi:membrane associated rhomboid family serine protease
MLFFQKQLLNLLYQMKNMKQNLMKSKLLLPILFAVVLAVLPVITFAQLGFDNTDTGGGPDVIDVPLDGGTVFLIAAGVLFGVYRLYKIAKKNLALG